MSFPESDDQPKEAEIEQFLDDLDTFIREATISEDGGMDEATWDRIRLALYKLVNE